MEKRYFRVMLGRASTHAAAARQGGFVGADFMPDVDLTNQLPDRYADFNERYLRVYLEKNPGKSRIAAGLACGMLWTITKSIAIGDLVLSPDGHGSYFVGEVTGHYEFVRGGVLPHRRAVHWYDRMIKREEMSESLQRSTGSIGTVSEVTKHSVELEQLIGGRTADPLQPSAEIEEPGEFVLEKHLEDFLVANWKSTELGKQYDIYEEDGQLVGQQYPSDTGPIDILAISKDKKEIVVIELKKGRASDVVVGQIQRYMGYVQEELAEPHQRVKGIIIAFDDDLRIRRARIVAPNIEFYTYKITFKLEKKS